jgi:hypothetical protein
VGRSLHPEVGWALGDGQEHGDDPTSDATDAEGLYDLLEREVIPEFYTRNEQGIPSAWVARMRESMARLTPRFSSGRTVREYIERHYLPMASAYRNRAADKGATGAGMANWRHALEQRWAALRFGEVKVETGGGQHVFEIQVCLNDLDPETVRVELYAGGLVGSAIRREQYRTMTAWRSRWKTHESYGSDDLIDERDDDAEIDGILPHVFGYGGVLLTNGIIMPTNGRAWSLQTASSRQRAKPAA